MCSSRLSYTRSDTQAEAKTKITQMHTIFSHQENPNKNNYVFVCAFGIFKSYLFILIYIRYEWIGEKYNLIEILTHHIKICCLTVVLMCVFFSFRFVVFLCLYTFCTLLCVCVCALCVSTLRLPVPMIEQIFVLIYAFHFP